MKPIAVLLTILAVMLGLATPAVAETKTFRDATGDVFGTDWDASGYPDVYRSGSTDISKMKVVHGKKKLTVTVFFTGQGKKNWNRMSIGIKPTTGKARYWISWQTFKYADDFGNIPNGLHSDKSPTKALPAKVERKDGASSVTFTVPTKAIGSPKAVRIAVSAEYVQQVAFGPNGLDYLPDMKRVGQTAKTIFSKPVKRGK